MNEEQPPAIDGEMKISELTVNQLFGVLNAVVQRSYEAANEGMEKAIADHNAKGKIIAPNFTPQSATRYAKRHQ